MHSVCSGLSDVIPHDWRSKTIATFDATYVRSKILSRDLISRLGTDYLVASSWLTSAADDKLVVVYNAMKTSFGDDIAEYHVTLANTRDLVAAILLYNVMIHKFVPTLSATDRRQALKDTKKKNA